MHTGRAGFLHLRRGDARRAIPILERCLALGELGNFALFVPRDAAELGGAYAMVGRLDEALRFLERAHCASAALPTHTPRLSRIVTLLSEVYFRIGRAADAMRLVDEALAAARAGGMHGDEAWALRVLAEFAAGVDPPDAVTAEGRYLEALSSASRRGMRPLLAQCHFGLGKLYRRTGKREQAHEHLTTAVTMYREMEMIYWLEQAEAEIAGL